MRIKLLAILVLLLLAMADVSHAGGRCGRWGGGWGGVLGRRLGRLGRPWLGLDGAGDHPLESASLLRFPCIGPFMLSSPGACIQRPRMRPIRRLPLPCADTLGEARLLPWADRRRLRSDDQPGHSQLSGRLRFADYRAPRLSHSRTAWESEN